MSIKILKEDLNSAYGYYKDKLDRETFERLIRLDPTFDKSRDKLGTYGKWILTQYLNPNSDVKSNQGHIRDLLTRFDNEKAHLINKDIMTYKSMAEVDKVLNDDDSYADLSHRQVVRQHQKDRKVAETEKDLIYQNSKCKIYSPSSYAASCKLGQGTDWCTASTESDYYYNYYPDNWGGRYFIIIPNSGDKKYQFHIESGQFMNEEDNPINPMDVVRELDCVDWFKNKLVDGLGDVKFAAPFDYLDDYLRGNYRNMAETLSIGNLSSLSSEDIKDFIGDFDVHYWLIRYPRFRPENVEWPENIQNALQKYDVTVQQAKTILASYIDPDSNDYPHFDSSLNNINHHVLQHIWKSVIGAYKYACGLAWLRSVRESAKHLGNDRLCIKSAGDYDVVSISVKFPLIWECVSTDKCVLGDNPLELDEYEWALTGDIISYLTHNEQELSQVFKPSPMVFFQRLGEKLEK